MKLKIPPPYWLLLTTGLMWLISRYTPQAEILHNLRWLALLPLVTAIGLIAASASAFRQASTTIHPQHPEQTRVVVDSGVFGFSRNPIYLGMALILVAWALWLAAPFAWLGVLLFVVVITCWQIVPEEEILLNKFGEPYRLYCQKVRRWF